MILGRRYSSFQTTSHNISIFISHELYPCKICGKTSKYFHDNKKHEESVHKNNYKCYLCQIPYTHLRTLKKHLADEHPDHEIKLKTCELCNERIPIELMENHLNGHNLDVKDATADSGPPQKRPRISYIGWVRINH